MEAMIKFFGGIILILAFFLFIIPVIAYLMMIGIIMFIHWLVGHKIKIKMNGEVIGSVRWFKFTKLC